MTSELSKFAARLREFISISVAADVRSLISPNPNLLETPHVVSYGEKFNALALELFALQFTHNAPYRRICEGRGVSPKTVEHWTQIPAVPTSAFKELELSCLSPSERKFVFHSSGTTEQKPSRHFHNAESLAVYEASLWAWFEQNIFGNAKCEMRNVQCLMLTPSPAQAPHSSLVHMFETVRQHFGRANIPVSLQQNDFTARKDARPPGFFGELAADGAWTLDFNATLAMLTPSPRPQLILGTAFSFVHLLDFLAEQNLRFELPPGSRVMETGGYKGRSRTMPKAELHSFITERLGVPASHIICEYGMSELSSQAYDHAMERRPPARRDGVGVQSRNVGDCSDSALKRELQRAVPEAGAPSATRQFRFPPWSRVQIISPETGREVAEGETGLIRVFDLANVFSVMAIQTEDLAVRHADGFELIGRAALAESRGCSLMTN